MYYGEENDPRWGDEPGAVRGHAQLPREVALVVLTVSDDDEDAARDKLAAKLGPDYTVLVGAP